MDQVHIKECVLEFIHRDPTVIGDVQPTVPVVWRSVHGVVKADLELDIPPLGGRGL